MDCVSWPLKEGPLEGFLVVVEEEVEEGGGLKRCVDSRRRNCNGVLVVLLGRIEGKEDGRAPGAVASLGILPASRDIVSKYLSNQLGLRRVEIGV